MPWHLGNVYDVADRFRARLMRHEAGAAAELVRAYAPVLARLAGQVREITERIAQERGPVPVQWLFERQRLQRLAAQVERDLSEWLADALPLLSRSQLLAAEIALDSFERLVLAQLGAALPPAAPPGTIARARLAELPRETVERIVAVSATGAPVGALLTELAPRAAGELRHLLIAGVATGQHPVDLARQAERALAVPLVRARTIFRTEILRAYRETQRQAMLANRNLVSGWIWTAHLSPRTCAFCWSMHGSVHALEERMATHPNCRCSLAPLTHTWRALGFDVPETRAEMTPGPVLFAQLPPDQQAAILGPAKYELYRDGLLRLEQLRAFSLHPRWGPSGHEPSLRELGFSAG